MSEVSEPSELYGLPVSEFTKERDRLVRALREEDRREEASAVAELRKPTVDAWGLNQVARRHPDRVAALVEVHRLLREASDGRAMREASEMRTRLFEELLELAAAALEEAGLASSGPVTERMSRTLLAAASDPETERALQAGVLARTAEISGVWPNIALPSAPSSDRRPDPALIEERERLEQRAEELSAEAVELRRVARQAREVLDQAREEYEEADRAARHAEKAAREAETEAKAARRRLRSPEGG
ncbi:MAG: hypothetical protein ACLFWM_03155 [Actinomycetota bacterium]